VVCGLKGLGNRWRINHWGFLGCKRARVFDWLRNCDIPQSDDTSAEFVIRHKDGFDDECLNYVVVCFAWFDAQPPFFSTSSLVPKPKRNISMNLRSSAVQNPDPTQNDLAFCAFCSYR